MTTLVLVTVAMWVQFIRDLVPLSISIITATSSYSLVVSSCVIEQLECVIQPILFPESYVRRSNQTQFTLLECG